MYILVEETGYSLPVTQSFFERVVSCSLSVEYNRFVQVDTTGNASSATVGQIPCNRVGLVHVGETFPRITPYFYPHQIIYRYGYVYHGIRSVVSQIEICRSAGRVTIGIQVINNRF